MHHSLIFAALTLTARAVPFLLEEVPTVQAARTEPHSTAASNFPELDKRILRSMPFGYKKTKRDPEAEAGLEKRLNREHMGIARPPGRSSSGIHKRDAESEAEFEKRWNRGVHPPGSSPRYTRRQPGLAVKAQGDVNDAVELDKRETDNEDDVDSDLEKRYLRRPGSPSTPRETIHNKRNVDDLNERDIRQLPGYGKPPPARHYKRDVEDDDDEAEIKTQLEKRLYRKYEDDDNTDRRDVKKRGLRSPPGNGKTPIGGQYKRDLEKRARRPARGNGNGKGDD